MSIASCTPKNAENSAELAVLDKKSDNLAMNGQGLKAKPKEPDFNKVLREAIYFSNSLEREALKLILNDGSLQKLTLFSVLSYIVETNSGAKKATPFGIDCGRYLVSRENKTIKISKSCVRPFSEIAKIKILDEDSLYEIEFFIKEWGNIVGLSVTLTGENVICQLRVKEKKLYGLRCENWSYQTESDQISSTIIKAKDFVFQRDSQRQFVIKGGFFKELVENKKIDIIVPIEGKIKIIEKEIQVIDEFMNKTNNESGVENEKEELKKENSKESSEKIIKEDSQAASEEGVQKINPEESQQTTSEENQRGGRGR